MTLKLTHYLIFTKLEEHFLIENLVLKLAKW